MGTSHSGRVRFSSARNPADAAPSAAEIDGRDRQTDVDEEIQRRSLFTGGGGWMPSALLASPSAPGIVKDRYSFS